MLERAPIFVSQEWVLRGCGGEDTDGEAAAYDRDVLSGHSVLDDVTLEGVLIFNYLKVIGGEDRKYRVPCDLKLSCHRLE